MKIIWLGEDHLHTSPDGTLSAGPMFTHWAGFKFPKGEAVEVPDTLAKKAEANPFFQVGESVKRGRPRKEIEDVEDEG